MVLKLFALPFLHRIGDGIKVALFECDLGLLHLQKPQELDSVVEEVERFLDPESMAVVHEAVEAINRRSARMKRLAFETAR